MAQGANVCECGYDRIAATTGRPYLSETMALPESPLAGRGMNFSMFLGVVLFLTGAGLAVATYTGVSVNIAYPYLVAIGAVAMGLLRYARGAAQARSE